MAVKVDVLIPELDYDLCLTFYGKTTELVVKTGLVIAVRAEMKEAGPQYFVFQSPKT